MTTPTLSRPTTTRRPGPTLRLVACRPAVPPPPLRPSEPVRSTGPRTEPTGLRTEPRRSGADRRSGPARRHRPGARHLRLRATTVHPAGRRLPVSRPTLGPARLTRRGRLLRTVAVAAALSGVLTAVLLSTASWLAGAPAGPGTAAVAGRDGAGGVGGVASRTVVVSPGDTLWRLAVRAEPGADPRLVTEQIRRLNRLADSTLQPGQRLVLPVGPPR